MSESSFESGGMLLRPGVDHLVLYIACSALERSASSLRQSRNDNRIDFALLGLLFQLYELEHMGSWYMRQLLKRALRTVSAGKP